MKLLSYTDVNYYLHSAIIANSVRNGKEWSMKGCLVVFLNGWAQVPAKPLGGTATTGRETTGTSDAVRFYQLAGAKAKRLSTFPGSEMSTSTSTSGRVPPKGLMF